MRTFERTASRTSVRTFDRTASGALPVISDPNFEYTTLLLPGNGTNGAQNNTFLDSSTNNFTITRNGNTTQGTFSPFSQTGWGNYFDGTNSKVTMASNAAMSLTGQFTIECWVYWNGTTLSYQNFIGSNDTFSSNASFFRVWGTGVATLGSKVGIGNPTHDGTSSVYSTTSLAPNQWYHVAATRDSSNIIRVFVNGNLERTGSTDTSTYDFGQGGTCIGDSPWDGAQGWYSGYISNLRVLKGTCLYTTSFTPPIAALTNISNTSLLTCQNNRFVDNSSNTFALTPAGNASIQAFSPFNPTAAWSAATYGGSGYFDGSGDYLSVPSSSSLVFDGDFTIECWIYPSSVSSNKGIFASSGERFGLIRVGANIYWLGSPDISATGVALTASAWQHVAVSRSSGTLRLFVNGVQAGSGSSSQTPALNAWYIGSNQSNEQFDGYISGLRVLKGTALYTAAFTPPTAPPTAITNTSLLLNFTNAGIYDATSKNDLETVGNAQISTTQSKFGGSSIYFDGNGDYLKAISTDLLNFGTGDFTIEFWSYFNSTADSGGLGMGVITNPTGTYSTIYSSTNGGTTLTFYNGSGIVSGTIALSTWQHIAVSRYNGTVRFFVNGIQTASATHTSAVTFSAAFIGSQTGSGGYFNGYLDDLRITKGIARYTSNFTPPTTAFPLL